MNLLDFLHQNNIRFEKNVDISSLISFRVGGRADVVIYPKTADEVAQIIRYFNQNSISYFVMGNGSNLLFTDEPFHRPIIKTDDIKHMSHRDNYFDFGAGVKLSAAAGFAASHSYGGMEFAHGIPGSVGGAVYMNAGAYGGEMAQIVFETEYVSDTGEIKVCTQSEHAFGYRTSFFADKNYIITGVRLKLTLGKQDEIEEKMRELMVRRKEKQPLNLPSAGSTFKRPEGTFAGKLIEDSGLRGYQIGGAQVSEKHCGFIVNKDNASFDDIEALIQAVQKIVLEKTGYNLECEVKIIK